MIHDDSATDSSSISRRQILTGSVASLSAVWLPSGQAAMPSGDDASLTAPTAMADPLTDQWSWVKAQQVLNSRLAYFDTATFGPTTRAALAAEYRAQEALHTDAQEFYATRYAADAVRMFCNRIASWLNCAADELTFTRGAQAGLEQIATLLELQPAWAPGDELVVCNQLPQATQSVWSRWARQRSISVKTVMLPSPLDNSSMAIEAFKAAITERTRVVMFSHVQHGDGAVLPVRELCQLARERGAVSIIEGALALGALTVSLRDVDCDVYSASFNHWLNAPPYTGVLYVRREAQASLAFPENNLSELWDIEPQQWPTLLGKLPFDFVRYAPQFQAVPAALALQEGLGRARIEARLRELTLYLRLKLQNASEIQFLTPTQPGAWTSMLSLRCARHSGLELSRWLRRNDYVAARGYTQGSSDALRISLHIYNSYDELDRLAQGLLRGARS